MNAEERRRLQRLDDLVQDSTRENLEKIQEADRHTQMEGMPFYDVYVDSASLINTPIKKSARY
ncbi:MAG: hypothetical protein D9C04_00705 [Nitrosopumilus sp. B06]|nr:MAG: hypothetical protein EB828_06170 [Nitrosopumilus sp. D6]RNJ80626.1 MAG: hypothetical protein D9C04_00705 [Nitrosopumilus sp. B06]